MEKILTEESGIEERVSKSRDRMVKDLEQWEGSNLPMSNTSATAASKTLVAALQGGDGRIKHYP